MSEMIEQVAKVLEEHFWRDDRDGTDDGQRLYIRTAARAVVAAMRNPTDMMVLSTQEGPACQEIEGDPTRMWRAMIDTALAGG